MSDKTCVGAIAGAFGVRGEVRLKSFTAVPEDIANYTPLTAEDGTEYTITLSRSVNNGFAARVSGITTKEQADALRGTQLYAELSQLPNLPDDEFYHADLIDLTVFDTGGAELGKVKTVQNNGAGDLLEVQVKGPKGTVFLPFTKAAVPTVDLTARRIIADPPEGLFE